MNDFKTVRAMGCIMIPLSYNSKLILKEYLKYNPNIKDGDYLFKKKYTKSQSFIRSINNIICKKTGTKDLYSSQLVRHIYLTCNFKDISKLNAEQRNLLSKYMLHSTSMNRNYLLIDDGSNTCYLENDTEKIGKKIINSKIPTGYRSFDNNLSSMFD